MEHAGAPGPRGNAILHHRHFQPVLIRGWSPMVDGITATI
jgi:hypothetical protein